MTSLCLPVQVHTEHLATLISFHDKMTHLVDEGKAVNVVYLGFSKTFSCTLAKLEHSPGETVLDTEF